MLGYNNSEKVFYMDDKSKEVLKTGTTTVGIVCKDGIILAADRRSTAGYIAHKKFHKVIQIADNMAVTVAGTVSEVQLLAKLIKAELKLKDLQTGRISNSKANLFRRHDKNVTSDAKAI